MGCSSLRRRINKDWLYFLIKRIHIMLLATNKSVYIFMTTSSSHFNFLESVTLAQGWPGRPAPVTLPRRRSWIHQLNHHVNSVYFHISSFLSTNSQKYQEYALFIMCSTQSVSKLVGYPLFPKQCNCIWKSMRFFNKTTVQ